VVAFLVLGSASVMARGNGGGSGGGSGSGSSGGGKVVFQVVWDMAAAVNQLGILGNLTLLQKPASNRNQTHGWHWNWIWRWN